MALSFIDQLSINAFDLLIADVLITGYNSDNVLSGFSLYTS